MVGNIATILLLDSISKKFIKTNTTELGLMGITIVNSFDEITDDMLSNNKNLIILESYFQIMLVILMYDYSNLCLVACVLYFWGLIKSF